MESARTQTISREKRITAIIGGIFLLGMASLHGSGIAYVSGLMSETNAADFLKDIFPILFVHPSVHLVGLAVLGFVALTMGDASRKVYLIIFALVLVDAAFGFYLKAWIPGILLTLAALLYGHSAGLISGRSRVNGV